MNNYPERPRIETQLAGRLVAVVPEGHQAYGLAAAVDGLRILTYSSGECVSALRALGAKVVPVPPSAPPLSTGRLINSELGADTLRRWAPASVIVFRPSVGIAHRLRKLRCSLLGPEAYVARHLENKRRFRAMCRERGIPVVDSVEVEWPATEGLSSMGWPRVVQSSGGYAGRRTWLWEAPDSPPLSSRFKGQVVLVAERLSGPTWTANAVVTPEGVLVGAPMRQLHGDPRLAPRPFTSSGVEIGGAGTELISDALSELTQRVGEMAREEGYFGFFGLDAIAAGDELRAVEMNARLTATLTAGTLAELEAGEVPLTVLHALTCSDFALPEGDLSRPSRAKGGHLLIRRTKGNRVASLPLGTYEVEHRTLRHVSEAAGWPSGRQVTVWPAGSSQGGPRDVCLRVLVGSPTTNQDGRFLPWADELIEALVRPTEEAAGTAWDERDDDQEEEV